MKKQKKNSIVSHLRDRIENAISRKKCLYTKKQKKIYKKSSAQKDDLASEKRSNSFDSARVRRSPDASG